MNIPRVPIGFPVAHSRPSDTKSRAKRAFVQSLSGPYSPLVPTLGCEVNHKGLTLGPQFGTPKKYFPLFWRLDWVKVPLPYVLCEFLHEQADLYLWVFIFKSLIFNL